MIKVMKSASGVKQGMKLGKWTVLGKPFSKDGNKYAVECKCDCGNVSIVTCNNLARGRSKQCQGCKGKAFGVRLTIHGAKRTRLYEIWCGMKKRCSDHRCSNYAIYGGRGITVCSEWQESYLSFRDWSMTNGYKEDLQIDRFPDNDGNYEPGNCRWVTRVVNCNNTRTNRWLSAFGENKTLAEWARDSRCVVSYHSIRDRIALGWSVEAAIITPTRTRTASPI